MFINIFALSTDSEWLRQRFYAITITVSYLQQLIIAEGIKMKDVIKQLSKQNNIAKWQIESEIQKAVREAMKSRDPKVQAFWKEIAPDGKEPPIERIIEIIALKVRERCAYK